MFIWLVWKLANWGSTHPMDLSPCSRLKRPVGGVPYFWTNLGICFILFRWQSPCGPCWCTTRARHTRTIPFGAATCGHPLDDWEFSGTSANGDDGFGVLADGGPFLFVPWRRGQLREILKWDAVCWMMLCQWDFGGRRSMPEICNISESLEIGSLCTSGSKWVSIENSPTPCLMMLKAGDTVVPLNDPCSKTCPATKKNMRWWRWRWYEHVWNIANICKHLQTNDT